VHEQDPAGQFVNEQVEPCAHPRTHPPAEQSTVHVAPVGHDVLQWPLEQATLQVPSPQYVKQRPLEQSRLQSPDGGHVSSQFPEEQSIVHGELAHVLWQLPMEQGHMAPEHERFWRDALVPGSDTAGPPFGVPPGLTVLLDPPHATTIRAINPRHAKPVFIKCLLHKRRCRRLAPFRHVVEDLWPDGRRPRGGHYV
jgi:hypothetical protein